MKLVAGLLQNAFSFLSMVHTFKQGQINASNNKLEQMRALEDICLGNHRGQNPDLRTAMQYLLAGLLLYFLVALTPENYVRTWNLGFSWSVKSQGKYPTSNNQNYFQPHKALVTFWPFRMTDPILIIALRHYWTEMGPTNHTPQDLTAGWVKHPRVTLHLKGCALTQQRDLTCCSIPRKSCALLWASQISCAMWHEQWWDSQDFSP